MEETLTALRALAKQVNEGDPADAWMFAELFAQLDDWLCQGGAMPAAWQQVKED